MYSTSSGFCSQFILFLVLLWTWVKSPGRFIPCNYCTRGWVGLRTVSKTTIIIGLLMLYILLHYYYRIYYPMNTTHKKSEVILVADRVSLWGCEMSRIQHCPDSWLTDGGYFSSLARRPRFMPRNFSIVIKFLLTAGTQTPTRRSTST
jgi:hypothetical protein